jgi:ubiquinone/menaquinone biosynthesis C-methylase UbiE
MITKNNINEIDYSEIVAILNERNRPSGGIQSIQSICVNAFILEKSNVLEIGSNTGFTCVNIALLTGANVTGIDINLRSIEKARNYAKEMGVDNKVKFCNASGTDIPFSTELFDLVWASNVTSFINDKKTAISEYVRVLKNRGYLAIIPIYYKKTPPKELIEKVSCAISSNVKVWDKNYWIKLISSVSNNLELVYQSDWEYYDQAKNLNNYLKIIFTQGKLDEYSKDEQKLIKKRYKYFISLFNENLKYCGFSVLLFQKRKIKDQLELFTSRKT